MNDQYQKKLIDQVDELRRDVGEIKELLREFLKAGRLPARRTLRARQLALPLRKTK